MSEGSAAINRAAEIDEPATKDTLWHTLRADLERYYPETRENALLMCPTCGRFRTYDEFTLEHIIPRQALDDDPPEVKAHPATPKSVRAGLILLCNAPLRMKEGQPRKLGCNGWKGAFYDTAIREILNGRVHKGKYKKATTVHQIAPLCAAYLAMVREYGYQVALTPAGVLMRMQFFQPWKFRKEIPQRSQILLTGQAPPFSADVLDFWSQPFTFDIEDGTCLVRLRSVALYVPISRDPRVPIATHLRIVPERYKLRPTFQAVLA